MARRAAVSPSHARTDAHAVAEADRGRRATHPKAIPATGWKDIVSRTFRDVEANSLPSPPPGRPSSRRWRATMADTVGAAAG